MLQIVEVTKRGYIEKYHIEAYNEDEVGTIDKERYELINIVIIYYFQKQIKAQEKFQRLHDVEIDESIIRR